MKRKLLLLLAATLSACSDTNGSPQTADSPSSVVDSILPVQEQIRRFKTSRNNSGASGLTGGATSRDALVHDFIAALERADTTALQAIVLDAAEFIDLYYPSSLFARPPYQQSPDLRWFLVQENSRKGLTRLLRRYGGKPAGFSGYTCAQEAVIEGENRIWDRCRVSWSQSATPIRVFSTIIERDGHFKIFSYANDL